MGYIIAIDGPSGVGKSTVAKKLSKILGIDYIDTGAMYRAIACNGQRQTAHAHHGRRAGRIGGAGTIADDAGPRWAALSTRTFANQWPVLAGLGDGRSRRVVGAPRPLDTG